MAMPSPKTSPSKSTIKPNKKWFKASKAIYSSKPDSRTISTTSFKKQSTKSSGKQKALLVFKPNKKTN
jgi:hypothetical protein